MKNIISAVTGKKALITFLIIAAAAFVLDIATSVRQGRIVDFGAMTSVFVSVTLWASVLDSKEKKNAVKENGAN